MGKRIPGKKHRGIKDPLAQKAAREESLKYRINAPPKDHDYQEIPKSLERLMKLKQLTKEGVFNKQRKKNRNKNKLMDTSKLIPKEKVLPGMTKPDRDLPLLVQRKGEANRAFMHRVHLATNDFIKEVNFEVKHNMKMKRDEKTGEVKFDKIELDPVDKMFQDKLLATSKKHKRKKRVPGDITMEGLSKTARRRLKLKAKMERRNKMEGETGEEDEFKRFQDKVEFNEVVHRPPQLTVHPRKADVSDVARKPASKPGLLLAQMLSTGDGQRRDLTGRRKDLSVSDRRRLDSAQAAAIQAYRQLKGKRPTAIT